MENSIKNQLEESRKDGTLKEALQGMGFNRLQSVEIAKGLNNEVDITKYADKKYDAAQMKSIRLALDRINIIGEVKYTPRLAAASGRGPSAEAQDISVVTDKDEYYYEVAEFIDLVLSGKRQSGINSHEHSLITLEIIDEVRRQLGIRYPADRY